MEKRTHLRLITILAAVIIGAWTFLVVPALERRREYSGEITGLSERKQWWRTEYSFSHNPADYNYFWHVKCDDGRNITVRVPYGLWKEGEEGFRVEKAAGSRWPEIDSPEYRKRQEEKEKILETILGQ